MENLILLNQSEFREMLRQEIQSLKQLIEKQNLQSNQWLSSEEVPEYLGVSRKTWQNYRDKKLLPFSQIGRKIWVLRSDLDAFIEKGLIGKHIQTSL